MADVGLAERVLANVVENAVSHGGAGRVTVRGRAGPAARSPATSSTTGRGCRRATGTRSSSPSPAGGAPATGDRGPGNLGLGLTVARGFADRHGRHR